MYGIFVCMLISKKKTLVTLFVLVTRQTALLTALTKLLEQQQQLAQIVLTYINKRLVFVVDRVDFTQGIKLKREWRRIPSASISPAATSGALSP